MRSRCLALAFAVSAVPTLAVADPIWSPLSGEWLVTVKGNLVGSPSYDGASKMAFLPYPSLSVRRAGTPLAFSSPDDNISLALIDEGWLKFGPSARFVGERRASSHRELTGLRDRDWTLEAGAFGEVWANDHLRFRLDVRRGFHGHKGIVANLGSDYVLRSGAFTFSLGPRLAIGDARYTRDTFGVTPAESIASGRLAAFRPSGGVTSAGVAGAVSYDFSDRWRSTLWGRYDRLTQDAARSPISNVVGSRNQFTLGLILAHTFNVTVPR